MLAKKDMIITQLNKKVEQDEVKLGNLQNEVENYKTNEVKCTGQ